MTATGTKNVLLTAALDYAGRGWHVFPCHRDKTPATMHGVKDATTDPDRIRRWWTGQPNASIGVACGPAGLVVIDVDVEKGGFASWQRLKAAHGIDDGTLTSITGGGGRHLLYRAPAGFRGRNSAGKLGPGVDVRADGGYIIAPPSGHPSGREYLWDPAQPALEPIPLPDRLRLLLEPRAPAAVASPEAHAGQRAAPALRPDPAEPAWRAALNVEIEALRCAVEGTRNDRLNTAAFKLGRLVAGHDQSRRAVGQALLAAARQIGLGDHEALATIRSGLDAGAREPAPDEPPRPARDLVLPDWPDRTPEEPGWLADAAGDEPAPTRQPAAAPAARAQPDPRPLAPGLYRAALAWEPRPARQFIVDGLLWRGDLAVLYGEGGIGKTYAMIDMAVAVAMIEPWLGRESTPCNVLIVDEESGQARMLDRLERTMRGHGIAPGTDVPIYAASFATWNLRLKPDAQRLRNLIAETQAGLVIIDALVDVMLGGDENLVRDVQPVLHNLRIVAQETGAAIVLIHHANKAGGQRGTTAIRGAVETLLCLSTQEDDGPVLKLETEKMRDAEPIKLALRMAFDTVTASFRLHKADPPARFAKYSKAEEYVLHYLQDHGLTNIATLQEHADGCSAESARRAVYSLAERGVVKRVGSAARGVPASYALADEQPAS